MAPSTAPSAGRPSRFSASVVIGLVLTAAILALSALGGLNFLERPLIDLRHRLFARTSPAPWPGIVHIDIDDTSLQRIGRWPWPRSYLARVVDELHRAGAAVIGFDLLLDDPQPPQYLPDPRAPQDRPALLRIDHDQRFAQAITRAGNVLLPVNLAPRPPLSPVARRALQILADQPFLSDDRLYDRLDLPPDQRRPLAEILPSLRDRAFHIVLRRYLADHPQADLQACRKALLDDRAAASTVLSQLFEKQYDRCRALHDLASHLGPDSQLATGNRPDLAISVPTARLAAAAAATGFVTYETDPDGVLRSAPMLLAFQGRTYPHFALAMVCRYLGVRPDRLVTDGRTLLIPDAVFPLQPDRRRTIRLPLLQPRPSDRWRFRHNRLAVTWPTNASTWQQLYCLPDAPPGACRHFPIGPLVETADLLDQINTNELAADAALLAVLEEPALANAFNSRLLEQYDQALTAIQNHRGDIDPTLLQQRDQCRRQFIQRLEMLADVPPGQTLQPDEQRLVDRIHDALQAHRRTLQAAEQGRQRVQAMRARLRSLCDGAICLVGWTATGALADFLPTSLHDKCPGVVIHGAFINAILTGHFLRRAPLAVDLLVTLLLGLAATLVAARFPPVSALLMVLGLVATYFLVNGMTLFDWADLQVEVAGPATAAAANWMAVTVWRLLTEQRQRLRITRQFKNYVSPDLVDLLVENPHLIKMEGESRELTCMFTDIAGFTSISQKLGPEATARLLNRYLGVATEHLMAHHATVNKYLGDGIMAFWGAPVRNPHHALDACRSILHCLQALANLDNQAQAEGLPPLFLRVGLASGTVMVGDFGAPPRRSDYTVIGDTVNLAARLESANKQFGTQVLLSDRTYQLVRDHMLARPIGRIVVVGRNQGEPVWQLLNSLDQASAEQHELARLTTAVVEAYTAGQFDQCMQRLEELAGRFGPSRFIDLYRRACAYWKNPPAGRTFDGTIVLTEK